MDDSIVCRICGCVVGQKKVDAIDYKETVRKSNFYVTASIVVMILGIFCWIYTWEVALFLSVIAEAKRIGSVPLSVYETCDLLALNASRILFFIAEVLALVPRERFNRAFKKNNGQLLLTDKLQFKIRAKVENEKLQILNSAYRVSSPVAIIALILLIISSFVPSMYGI